MKQLFTKIFSDSIIYGVASIISSLLSIFLVPLYTKVFSPFDYGIISIITTTFAFISLLIVFGIDNSVCVWYWERPSMKDRLSIFNTFIGFIGLTGLLIAFLTLAFGTYLSVLFFNSEDYSILFYLLSFNVLFAGFQKVVNIWCRMRQKPLLAMVYSLSLLAVNLTLNIVLILYFKIGVKGVFYSQAFTSLMGFIMMIVIFGKWINLRSFDGNMLKRMLHFSLPLVPATLMYWLMTAASSYFIKIYIKDNSEIGLYQVGSNIANIISLGTYSFFQAWGPISLQISSKDNARKIYSIVFELYCTVGFFLAFALLFVSKNVLVIFTNDRYLDAATVIGLLAINVVIAGIPNFIAIANNLAKKNSSYAIAVTIGALTTVLFFILLIPRMGKEGAAIAMVVGNISISIYLAIAAHRIYPIPYKYNRILLIVAIEACSFVMLRFYVDGLFLQIVSTLSLAFILLILYAKLYNINIVKIIYRK